MYVILKCNVQRDGYLLMGKLEREVKKRKMTQAGRQTDRQNEDFRFQDKIKTASSFYGQKNKKKGY